MGASAMCFEAKNAYAYGFSDSKRETYDENVSERVLRHMHMCTCLNFPVDVSEDVSDSCCTNCERFDSAVAYRECCSFEGNIWCELRFWGRFHQTCLLLLSFVDARRGCSCGKHGGP